MSAKRSELRLPENAIARHVLAIGSFAVLWVCGLVLIFDARNAAYGDPPVVALEAAVTIEVFVLYVILRPLSFKYSCGRAAVAFTVFALWTYPHLLLSAHAPKWLAARVLWLMIITSSLLLLTILCPICKIVSEYISTSRDWSGAKPFMFPWEVRNQELKRTDQPPTNSLDFCDSLVDGAQGNGAITKREPTKDDAIEHV